MSTSPEISSFLNLKLVCAFPVHFGFGSPRMRGSVSSHGIPGFEQPLLPSSMYSVPFGLPAHAAASVGRKSSAVTPQRTQPSPRIAPSGNPTFATVPMNADPVNRKSAPAMLSTNDWLRPQPRPRSHE